MTVNNYNKSGKLDIPTIADNKIIVPSQEDNYYYEIIAQWENGSTVSYAFSVEYSE